MEQLSDNNLDALFQKAAENYPLKTDNKNWNAVALRLHPNLSSSIVKSSKKWKYAALLIILLSAGGFFSYKFYTNSASSVYHSQVAAINLAKTKNAILQNKRIITRSKNQKETNTLQNTITKSTRTSSEQEQPIQTHTFSSNKKAAFSKPTYIDNIDNNTVSQALLSGEESTPNLQSSVILNTITDKNPNSADVAKNSGSSVNKAVENNDKNKANSVESIKSQHIKLTPQPKTFYGEFYFAPNFSTVKSQKVNSPGYNVGVAIGYRISKHFSAEFGLERLHTNLFTDAKYLDKSDLRYKPNTNLQAVNGKSKLTEIPVVIKYNLSKNNEHFFVTAGTNIARITHSEKYNYYIKKNGEPREISKSFGALTATKFLSEINFSAGYQTSISGIVSLKIQPYYQIPLKGIGVGNLPVTNFGVNVGIVKDLK